MSGVTPDRVKATATAITAIAAVATLFYWVGYNGGAEKAAALKEQVETYRVAQSMSLSSLLDNLRAVAAGLDNDLQAADLSTQLARLSDEKNRLEAELAQKSRVLEETGFRFGALVLTEDNTQYLYGSQLIVCLTSAGYGSATVKVNNQSYTVSVGSYVVFPTRDGDVRFVLEEAAEGKSYSDPDQAQFTVLEAVPTPKG